jgi:hypothetical protein
MMSYFYEFTEIPEELSQNFRKFLKLQFYQIYFRINF